MNERPLAGRVIVVCRPPAQAAPLSEKLVSLGADVIHLSLIEAEPVPDDGELARVLTEIDGFDWIVFTSANAVGPIVAASPVWPVTAPVAAVGGATAAQVRASGAEVRFVPPTATAAALAEYLPVHRGARVLAPLGELANNDLQFGLERRGVKVTRVTAYRLAEVRAVPSELAARAAGADAVLLTSPSAVDRFSDITNGRWPRICVSIGPRTSRRLGERVGHPDSAVTNPIRRIQADHHSVEGLIAALVNTLGP